MYVHVNIFFNYLLSILFDVEYYFPNIVLINLN